MFFSLHFFGLLLPSWVVGQVVLKARVSVTCHLLSLLFWFLDTEEEWRVYGDRCGRVCLWGGALGSWEASSPKLGRWWHDPKPSLPPEKKTKNNGKKWAMWSYAAWHTVIVAKCTELNKIFIFVIAHISSTLRFYVWENIHISCITKWGWERTEYRSDSKWPI